MLVAAGASGGHECHDGDRPPHIGNGTLPAMGRGSALVSLLGLAGCAQVWGLDPTSGPEVPLPPTASLAMQRLSIGATLVRAPAELSAATATYLIADAGEPTGFRRIAAAWSDATTSWTAEVPEGVPASVEFTVPDDLEPYRRLWTFPQRELRGVLGYYEHPGLTTAPTGATVDVQLTLPSGYASGETFRLFAIGPWAFHDFTATALPPADTGATTIGPVSIEYDANAWKPAAITRPLQRITTADRVVALRYAGNELTAAGEVPAFELAPGANQVASALSAVLRAPLDVRLQPDVVASRLGATTPLGTTQSMQWRVVAAPAWEYANSNGVQLHAASVAPTDAGMITTPYGNPFVGLGWSSLFAWTATRQRVYTVASLSLPVTLSAGLHQFDVPREGLVLDQPAGLPVLITMAKVPLTSDGMSVTLEPGQPVELSLVADRASNTLYQYNVYELVPNTASPPTALAYKVVYVALGPSSEMTIPHDVFVPGRFYTIRAHCISGGFPSVGEGNLQHRDLPYAVGYLDSAVFSVTPS
jgi:hypothetical protein